MENDPKPDDLIGPRSDERGLRPIDDYHSQTGEPLWMSLLGEENTLAPTTFDVQEAKNKLQSLINSHPDVVNSCKDKSTEECRRLLEPLI